MTDHDLAVISAIAAAIAVAFAYVQTTIAARARREAAHTALAQGVFARPKLVCSLFSEDAPQNLILATKLADGQINELPAPLCVRNTGDRVAENASIYVRLPKDLIYGNAFDVMEIADGVGKVLKLEINLLREGNFGTLVVSLPRLQPYEKLDLALPLSIRQSTEVVSETRVRMADNVPSIARIRVLFSYTVTIFFACEGTQASVAQYDLQVFDTANKSLAELVNERNDFLRKDSDADVRSLGFWNRVSKRFRDMRLGQSVYKKIRLAEYGEESRKRRKGTPIVTYNKAIVHEGLLDTRDDTLWVPSLRTSVFGSTTRYTAGLSN